VRLSCHAFGVDRVATAPRRQFVPLVGNHEVRRLLSRHSLEEEDNMDGLIYLIGLIVIIMAILSFFGLR
jgi:hypothetical protein